ncbi:hypothetical protein F5887DRAFT_191572 [Amanita rubescens]|nr:hypothetical protein F5887DRAFT_191572 [Amanita rubescens]
MTELKDVTLTNDSLHDVVALVPPLSGFSLNDRFGSLEKEMKEMKERDQERERETKRMKQEHEKGMEEMRRNMRETDNWIIQGDTDAFDKIMLRNLLDKSQAVLAHAQGSLKSKKSLSLHWRRRLANMDQQARRQSVKAMLAALDIPAAQHLSVSATAVELLTEDFSRIRKDGDEVAHKNFINLDRCRQAIKRSKRSVSECEALNLFLELVGTYKWD